MLSITHVDDTPAAAPTLMKKNNNTVEGSTRIYKYANINEW